MRSTSRMRVIGQRRRQGANHYAGRIAWASLLCETSHQPCGRRDCVGSPPPSIMLAYKGAEAPTNSPGGEQTMIDLNIVWNGWTVAAAFGCIAVTMTLMAICAFCGCCGKDTDTGRIHEADPREFIPMSSCGEATVVQVAMDWAA